MSYQEKAITFDCQGEQLVGIISQPCGQFGATQNTAVSTPTTGLIIIVGGPQYRAGSHRQFVLLARALASAGIHVLRFDYRGMGDSTNELRSFDNVNDDIAAAISALQFNVPSIKNIALWGLCDGASAALLFCHARQDDRITGLCLLNPWVRSEASLAKTQVKHYYTQRLRQKEFWLKLFSGKVAASAAGGLLRNIKAAFGERVVDKKNSGIKPFQTRMAQGWMQFKGPILLILSGNDYVAKEFLEYFDTASVWKSCLRHSTLTRQDISDADHTFSNAHYCSQVANLTLAWLSRF
ncbi:hydrolase 1, exosortase A system-associated [Polaromonas sp. OV174]|uniref:hydrolase 1, exosortase A system-associated n=1 Tax=Polaromonas sp. OV174 TaxID=1855300 RepID=UPI000B8A1A09|nr:hydrolase 1, exosortase A system-associated [Polaromonas sp. OV174]